MITRCQKKRKQLQSEAAAEAAIIIWTEQSILQKEHLVSNEQKFAYLHNRVSKYFLFQSKQQPGASLQPEINEQPSGQLQPPATTTLHGLGNQLAPPP